MCECLYGGCFVLNFVSELFGVFSDGRDDLRHRIQHQVVRRGLGTKHKIKPLFFTEGALRADATEANPHTGVRPRLCSELAARPSVRGHWSSGQGPC